MKSVIEFLIHFCEGSSLIRGKWIEINLIVENQGKELGLPSFEGSGLKLSISMGNITTKVSSLIRGKWIEITMNLNKVNR